MTREQIEQVAKKYGIKVSYEESGKGGLFFCDSGGDMRSINADDFKKQVKIQGFTENMGYGE